MNPQPRGRGGAVAVALVAVGVAAALYPVAIVPLKSKVIKARL